MTGNRSRAELLGDLRRAGREHGDATVLFHSALANRLGLHPTDYKALGILERFGPMSAGELGRRTGLAAASVTNLIDRMSAKGFVRREPDPADRRRLLLRAGVDELTANDLFAPWQPTAQLWKRYSDTELAVILDFLSDAADRLRVRTETFAENTDGTQVGEVSSSSWSQARWRPRSAKDHNGEHDDR